MWRDVSKTMSQEDKIKFLRALLADDEEYQKRLASLSKEEKVMAENIEDKLVHGMAQDCGRWLKIGGLKHKFVIEEKED